MTGGDEPLLYRRPSSDQADEQEEEDALLTGERTQKHKTRGWKFWREIGLFTWALIATAALIILAVVYQKQKADDVGHSPKGKHNLIMMISDGMGPTSLAMTRSYKQYQYGLPWSEHLVLDSHLIGSSRTRSTSSLVTDSAAGATAFSCR